jgi:hypothetical protein
MMGNSSNPYWQKAIQYQQRSQRQTKSQPNQGQEQGPRHDRAVKEDFGNEWRDRNVEMECVKGQAVEVIKGRIVDISKYWLKLFVNNQILYLNKAYILSIRPAEIERGASGERDVGRKQ